MGRKKRLPRKGAVLFPVLAAAAGFLTFICFPLTSKMWDLEYNEEMTARKEEFLARLEAGREERLEAVWSEEPPPNIVIITADDLGKTDMSYYADLLGEGVGTVVDTPNMDKIGESGVVFTEAYCTSPICSPSRAGMLTGRYHQRSGFEVQPQNRYATNRLEYFIVDHFIDTDPWFLVDLEATPRRSSIEKQGLPPSELTLAELLSSYGYATGITGKWHLGYSEEQIPNSRGYDYQYGFYEAFSLFAPEGEPGIVEYRHDYYANKHIWKQRRTKTCAIRRNHEEIYEPGYLTFRIAEEAVRFLDRHRHEPFYLNVPFSAPHTPFQAPEEYVNRFARIEDLNKRVYYGMIAALDDAVGIIIEALERYGLAENTLIMFASDNGGATYTRATENAPLKGGKFSNFEGGLNVPCMLRWDGRIQPGTVVDDPVILTDFFVTAAAAAGAPLPEDRVFDGADLLPHVGAAETVSPGAGAEGPPHEFLFWRAVYNKAVRQGPWKLILDEKAGRTLLYNMEEDKIERRNVASEHPEVVARLKEALVGWEKGLPGPLWPRVMDFRFTIDGEEYDFAL